MSTPLTPASLVQLMCFVRVIEAGSFAEAGRRIGMTTAGVSKAISRFETAHGMRLLHRSTHALSLTDEGAQLLQESREVLRGFEQLGAVLSQTADGGRAGRVRLTAPPGFARACLLPLLPRLLAAHPEIRVEIQASYSLVDLADEGVDLALRAGRIVGLPGHVGQTLFHFPWIACATPDYLVRRGTPQSPNDLAAHDLIGFRNSHDGRIGAWRFRNPDRPGPGEILRHEPDARMIFDDGSAAWTMMCSGQGILWAPGYLALDDLRSGRVIEVLREWRCDEMPLSLIRRERRLTPQRVKAVVAFLCDALRDWQSSAAE